jgi:hypothetical protein
MLMLLKGLHWGGGGHEPIAVDDGAYTFGAENISNHPDGNHRRHSMVLISATAMSIQTEKGTTVKKDETLSHKILAHVDQAFIKFVHLDAHRLAHCSGCLIFLKSAGPLSLTGRLVPTWSKMAARRLPEIELLRHLHNER